MPDEPKSEQTREIEAALEASKQRVSDQEEWSDWESDIQAQVDKLISESRMNRVVILGMGGIGLLALGIGAMAMKAVSQIMLSLNQLGENQHVIARAIGLGGPTDSPIDTVSTEAEKMPYDEDETVVAPPVAPPFEGPISEASEETRRQLRSDKKAGIIDQFKSEEPDAD